MKKIIFTLIIIALATSCSHEEQQLQFNDNVHIEQKRALLDLRSKIKTLNNHFEKTYGISKEIAQRRKSLKSFFTRILNVVVSDVGGALKGAINGQNILRSAGEASARAGAKAIIDTANELVNGPSPILRKLKKNHPTDTIGMTDFICTSGDALIGVVPTPSADTIANTNMVTLDSIGFYHNQVIINLFSEHNSISYWANLSTTEIFNLIDSAVAETTLNSIYIDNRSDNELQTMASFCDNLSEMLDTYNSTTDFCSAISSFYPELGDAFCVMTVYIEGLINQHGTENLMPYTNEVLTLIDASDILSELKSALRSAAIIALASAKLWIV